MTLRPTRAATKAAAERPGRAEGHAADDDPPAEEMADEPGAGAAAEGQGVKEFLEYVAKSLVEKPDSVWVEVEDEGDETLLTLGVDQEDMGRVIGRDGIANAIRSLRVMAAGTDATSSRDRLRRRVTAAPSRVLGAKGLKGGIRVEVLTDFPERLEPDAELWAEGESAPRRIRHVESGGRVPVIHLDGLDTREAAEALAGRYLEVPGARSRPARTTGRPRRLRSRPTEPRSVSSSRSSARAATRCIESSGRRGSGSSRPSAAWSIRSTSRPA